MAEWNKIALTERKVYTQTDLVDNVYDRNLTYTMDTATQHDDYVENEINKRLNKFDLTYDELEEFIEKYEPERLI